LSACTGQNGPLVQTHIAEITIPPQNRSCPQLPLAPDPDDPEITQRDVAIHLVSLTQMAEHCKRDLRTTISIIDDFNQTAKEKAR